VTRYGPQLVFSKLASRQWPSLTKLRKTVDRALQALLADDDRATGLEREFRRQQQGAASPPQSPQAEPEPPRQAAVPAEPSPPPPPALADPQQPQPQPQPQPQQQRAAASIQSIQRGKKQRQQLSTAAAPEAQPPPSKAPDSAGPPSAPEDITCFRKGENAYYCHTAWEGYFEMPGRGWKREGKPFKAWTDGAAPPAGAVPIYVWRKGEMAYYCHESWTGWGQMEGWGWSQERVAFYAFPPEAGVGVEVSLFRKAGSSGCLARSHVSAVSRGIDRRRRCATSRGPIGPTTKRWRGSGAGHSSGWRSACRSEPVSIGGDS